MGSCSGAAFALPRQSPITTAFVGLLYVAGNLSNAIYPVFVTSMIASGQITASSAGTLATAEFLPFGLAILFAGRFFPERHLRLIAGVCVFIQLLMAYATTRLPFTALIPCRALFGVAGGTLIWIVYSYLARSMHASRLVGIYMTALIAVGVLWSWIGPFLVMPAAGNPGVIIFLSAPSLLALALLPSGPNDLPPLPRRIDEEGHATGRLSAASLLVLLSAGLWAAFMTIFWVYSEPLAAPYTGELVRHWLTISLLFQILGAASAAVLSERLPHRFVISCGLIILIAQIVSILLGVDSIAFVGWTSIFGFFGYFLIPFFVAALIELDPSRRSVLYFPATQNLAGSFGPVLVSQVVRDTDLSSGLVIDLVAICISPAMFWMALGVYRLTQRTAPELSVAIPNAATVRESISRLG